MGATIKTKYRNKMENAVAICLTSTPFALTSELLINNISVSPFNDPRILILKKTNKTIITKKGKDVTIVFFKSKFVQHHNAIGITPSHVNVVSLLNNATINANNEAIKKLNLRQSMYIKSKRNDRHPKRKLRISSLLLILATTSV
jgi:hypothetical protein